MCSWPYLQWYHILKLGALNCKKIQSFREQCQSSSFRYTIEIELQGNHNHIFLFGSPVCSQSSLIPPRVSSNATVNMDEFVAFFHSFWRFVLSIRPPAHSGSKSFHETSVQCSIIQSGSTLEIAMTAWEDGGMDVEENPKVNHQQGNILVSEIVVRKVQVRGQEAWQKMWLRLDV